MTMYKNRLKNLRDSFDMKQKVVASLLNLGFSTYCEYENEYKIIPIKHLNTVCNFFHVSIDYVLGLNDSKTYHNYKDEINKKIMVERLKELRKEYNLTQNQLAKVINVATSTISDYERGINVIATPFLYQICKKYHISADYLLGKVNDPKYLKSY